MSLRGRTLFIIGITLLVLIVVLYVSAHFILLNSYRRLEEQNMERDVQRVINALNGYLDQLNTINHDWAGWNDTYTFIEDRNLDYIKDNLHNKSFIDLGLNLMLYANLSGEIVFYKAVDLEYLTQITPPSGIEQYLNDDLLLNHPNDASSITGLLPLDGKYLLLSSRPILTSEFRGPSRGTLVMGRFFDDEIISALEEATQLSISLWPYNSNQLPTDVSAAQAALDTHDTSIVQTFHETTVAGYSLIYDLNSHPAMMIKIDRPPVIYAQGQTSLSYFLTALVISGVIFIIVVLAVLERTVLSRLAYLSSAVDDIGKRNGALTLALRVRGRDELSRLTFNIQTMLDTINQTQRELQNANTKLEERVQHRTAQLAEAITWLEREILEKEQAQLELAAARDQALEALRMKTQILANVSHDSRTPLNVIILNTQLLQRYANLDEKWQQKLQNIRLSTTQLLNFFENLLEEARQTLGGTKLEETVFSPHDLLMETIQPMRVLSDQKGLSINTVIADDLPDQLYGDVKRLEQILSNLISNAIKFTNQGTITVGLYRPDETHWAIAVSDTGRGIATQDQSRIFDEFWQADGSMTRDVNRGVGLGLSIVKHLANLMDGQISVQSETGLGSVFTVVLPYKEVKEIL